MASSQGTVANIESNPKFVKRTSPYNSSSMRDYENKGFQLEEKEINTDSNDVYEERISNGVAKVPAEDVTEALQIYSQSSSPVNYSPKLLLAAAKNLNGINKNITSKRFHEEPILSSTPNKDFISLVKLNDIGRKSRSFESKEPYTKGSNSVRELTFGFSKNELSSDLSRTEVRNNIEASSPPAQHVNIEVTVTPPVNNLSQDLDINIGVDQSPVHLQVNPHKQNSVKFADIETANPTGAPRAPEKIHGRMLKRNSGTFSEGQSTVSSESNSSNGDTNTSNGGTDSTRSDVDPISSVVNSTYQDSCNHCLYAMGRDMWTGEGDFLVSALGYVIGLGNIWRFPYLCYRNGGGVFLIPYIIFMITAGLPLVFLEISFGQFSGAGVITAWKVSPMFKGVGYGMVIVSFLVGIYYNVILSWSVYYMFASMQSVLPWTSCDNDWNTEGCCEVFKMFNCTDLSDAFSENATCFTCANQNLTAARIIASTSTNSTPEDIIPLLNNHSIPIIPLSNDTSELSRFVANFTFPAEEYFYNKVLALSDSPQHLGAVHWEMVLCLLFTWVIIFISLLSGVRSTGKIVYFTVVCPYILLFILFIRTALLEGAAEGLVFFLHPDWSKLSDLNVWHDAANQVFFSLSVCYGGIITLSSSNAFNHNCYKDAITICAVNTISSIFFGFPVFCTLGYMANSMGIPLKDAVSTGLGLVFVVYPEALSHLPGAQWWSVFFFFMLLILGIDCQYGLVGTILTGLVDEFPRFFMRRRLLALLTICISMFICGIPFATQGGLYLLEILDSNATDWCVMVFGLLECVVLCWVYGYYRFSHDICLMFGKRPSKWWRFKWQVGTPAILLFLLLVDQLREQESEILGGSEFLSTSTLYLVGWLITVLEVIWIPVYAVYAVVKAPGTFLEKCTLVVRPTFEWGASFGSGDEDDDNSIPEYIRSDKEELPKGYLNHGLSLDGEDGLEDSYNAKLIQQCDDIDTGSIVWSEVENKERGNWTGRYDFLLSGLGYTIGIGNVWRFPYLVYKNGGGAFFFPYFLMLIFCGLPLFYMELAFGQFASCGPISIWKVSPLFKGIGYSVCLTTVLLVIYYNMINAWSVYYLFASMQKALPWATCDNNWNTPDCRYRGEPATSACLNVTAENVSDTWSNSSVLNISLAEPVHNASNLTCQQGDTISNTPSEEYFFMEVLHLSSSISEIGNIQWSLALCLLFCWMITFFSVIRGVKTVGKVVYVTVSFPYVIMLILLVRYCTIGEGHLDGIRYFVTPQWSKLAEAQVWGDAASQLFFSLGISAGGLIALSSYNRFHYDCYRDAFLICMMDTLTSIFAGFVVFAIIGVMANEAGTDVESVIESKYHGNAKEFTLVYIVFPEAVTQLPISPLWSILFFLMLFCLAIDSQFLMVETIIIAVMDEFGNYIGKRRTWFALCLCITLFLLGLPLSTEGGLYILILMDHYVSSWAPLIGGFLMCIALSWVYGVQFFCRNIRAMRDHDPSLWWKIMWKFVTPAVIALILVFTMVRYQPPTVNGQQIGGWAEVCGLILSVLPILPIPIGAVIQLILARGGDLRTRAHYSLHPDRSWTPLLRKHHLLVLALPGRHKHPATSDSFSSDTSLIEQSIFATQSSGMFALLNRKKPSHKAKREKSVRNKQVQTGKAGRRLSNPEVLPARATTSKATGESNQPGKNKTGKSKKPNLPTHLEDPLEESSSPALDSSDSALWPPRVSKMKLRRTRSEGVQVILEGPCEYVAEETTITRI